MQKLETILILFFSSLLLLVVGGVLIAVYLWATYSTIILILSGIVFTVAMLSILSKSHFFEFVHKTLDTCIEDRRERYKQALEIKAAYKTQANELSFHWQKQRDDTRLRTIELELQRITTIVESRVKQLEIERWAVEKEAGILSYQSTQTLYKPGSGEVINLSRQPAENLPQAPQSPAVDDLPQAPLFREAVALLKEGSIPLTWTIDGPRPGTLKDMLSMGLIGRPERGKTTALLYYVCLLLWMGAEVWVWDLHGELSALSGLNYFDRFADIVSSVPYIAAELDERDELYRETKLRTGVGRVRQPLVLIADEVPVLSAREKEQPKLLEYSPLYTLRRFTLEARKWNGFVFLSGQSLPHTVLPTLTRDNLSSRIILECSPNHARQMGLSKRAIDTLLPCLRGAPRGTHIADFSTWSEPELADIPYTDTADLKWVLKRRQEQQEPCPARQEASGNEQEPARTTHEAQTGAGYAESIDTEYRVLEEGYQPSLLQGAFHSQEQKLKGELLTVYQAIQRMKTTNKRKLARATGLDQSKVYRVTCKLRELGYITGPDPSARN